MPSRGLMCVQTVDIRDKYVGRWWGVMEEGEFVEVRGKKTRRGQSRGRGQRGGFQGRRGGFGRGYGYGGRARQGGYFGGVRRFGYSGERGTRGRDASRSIQREGICAVGRGGGGRGILAGKESSAQVERPEGIGRGRGNGPPWWGGRGRGRGQPVREVREEGQGGPGAKAVGGNGKGGGGPETKAVGGNGKGGGGPETKAAGANGKGGGGPGVKAAGRNGKGGGGPGGKVVGGDERGGKSSSGGGADGGQTREEGPRLGGVVRRGGVTFIGRALTLGREKSYAQIVTGGSRQMVGSGRSGMARHPNVCKVGAVGGSKGNSSRGIPVNKSGMTPAGSSQGDPREPVKGKAVDSKAGPGQRNFTGSFPGRSPARVVRGENT